MPELRAFCDIKGMAYSEADGEVQLVQAIMQDGRLSLNVSASVGKCHVCALAA